MLHHKTCTTCEELLLCAEIMPVSKSTEKTVKHKKHRKVFAHVCKKCGKQFDSIVRTARFCSRKCAGKGGYEDRNSAEGLNRPFTPDTVMLCHLYRARGESMEQIAKDLDRSRENILLALAMPLPKHRAAVVAEETTCRRNKL